MTSSAFTNLALMNLLKIVKNIEFTKEFTKFDCSFDNVNDTDSSSNMTIEFSQKQQCSVYEFESKSKSELKQSRLTEVAKNY